MIRTSRPYLLPFRRRGLTLTEVLIVITIMAILATLTASTVMRFVGVQEKNNTDALLRKLNTIVQRQWRSVIDAALKEPLSQQALTLSRTNPTDPATEDDRRARVIHVKLRLRQEFPQTFAEALTPPVTVLPALPTYTRALGGLTTTPSPEIQSSICLLLALTQSRGGSPLNPEDLGASSLGQWTDTPGTNRSLNYLVDGWQRPMLFIRFPTRFDDLNPGGLPRDGLNDTVDSQGQLVNTTWLVTPVAPGTSRYQFHTLLHELPDYNGTTPRSYRLEPVIVSAGPNGLTGLNTVDGRILELPTPPNPPGTLDPAAVANASDNISNRSLYADFARGQ